MKTIVSNTCPPSDGKMVELTMQRRDGSVFVFQTGEYASEHEMKRECGGCSFCIGILSFSFNGVHRMSSSHPTFRRWPCEPCESCAPKLERLCDIDRESQKLKDEARKILEYRMPNDLP